MMSKKTRPLFFALLIGGILSVLSCRGSNDDDTLNKQQQLLVSIGMILEQRHYSPKPIDDSFSVAVFNSYLSQLDDEKDLFLQSDIDSLSQYKYKIDDEIHGIVPMRFYPAAIAILKRRVEAAKAIYTAILAKPFDFTKDEMYQPIGDSLSWSNDAQETWRLRLKYRTLMAYSDLLSQRQAAKATDSIKKKTDVQLEKEARAGVQKYYDRYFKSKFSPGKFSVTDQFSLFVNTITHEMDPHTDYFAPVDERSFLEEMSNKFYGIGASLGEKDGQVIIANIMTGGAAWKSKKIANGDVILKVQNNSDSVIDLTGYTTQDAVKVIRGAKGSTVTLTIKRTVDGSVITVKMLREEVKLDLTTAKSVVINEGNKKIGYISLPEFYFDVEDAKNPSCADDIANELKKLKNENINGLIIDLRTNPGGSLQDVNKIIGYFVPQGPAVQVRNRNGSQWQLTDGNSSNQVLYDGPLVVMINEFSASASEIFTAAMQDYNRAIIVGSSSTYGKGTVQNQLPLGSADKNGMPQYGSLKMTIEKFYRINGGSNQLRGVSSDIVMPDMFEWIKDREKDDPNALPWDKINPAQYTPWVPAYNKDSIISRATARINADPIFKAIAQTNTWMGANENNPVSLNLSKYKERETFIKNMMSKDTAQDSKKNPLSVNVMSVDHDKFYNNPDKMSQDFYKGWLKEISQDAYIKQTVKIMDDMIGKQ